MRARHEQPGFTVYVDGERWTQVASFASAGPDDKVFTVNNDSGTLVFGDGQHGRRPANGAAVTVSYKDGGGETGNTAVSIAAVWPPKAQHYAVSLHDQSIGIRRLSQGVESFSGAKRVHYFTGQMLSAADFEDEQQYLLERRWLHNRALHGYGVVEGLGVSVSADASAPSVAVSPGIGIDRYGHELQLSAPLTVNITGQHYPLYVVIRYAERETDFVPAAGHDRPMPSRVEEGVSVSLEADGGDGIPVARLVRRGEGWEVDREYRPPRPR